MPAEIVTLFDCDFFFLFNDFLNGYFLFGELSAVIWPAFSVPRNLLKGNSPPLYRKQNLRALSLFK